MSRRDDGLPMLPPWLSESEVTQVGYEAPVENLPHDDLIPDQPRKGRFKNRPTEPERADGARPEKKRKGWRRGRDDQSEPSPAPWGEIQQGSWGQPSREDPRNQPGPQGTQPDPRRSSPTQGGSEAQQGVPGRAGSPAQLGPWTQSEPHAGQDLQPGPNAQQGPWNQPGPETQSIQPGPEAQQGAWTQSGPSQTPTQHGSVGAPDAGQQGRWIQSGDESRGAGGQAGFAPQDPNRQALPTRNPADPSPAFQPLGAGTPESTQANRPDLPPAPESPAAGVQPQGGSWLQSEHSGLNGPTAAPLWPTQPVAGTEGATNPSGPDAPVAQQGSQSMPNPVDSRAAGSVAIATESNAVPQGPANSSQAGPNVHYSPATGGAGVAQSSEVPPAWLTRTEQPKPPRPDLELPPPPSEFADRAGSNPESASNPEDAARQDDQALAESERRARGRHRLSSEYEATEAEGLAKAAEYAGDSGPNYLGDAAKSAATPSDTSGPVQTPYSPPAQAPIEEPQAPIGTRPPSPYASTGNTPPYPPMSEQAPTSYLPYSPDSVAGGAGQQSPTAMGYGPIAPPEQGSYQPRQPGPQGGQQGSAAIGYGPTAGAPNGPNEAAHTGRPGQSGPAHGSAGFGPTAPPQQAPGPDQGGYGPSQSPQQFGPHGGEQVTVAAHGPTALQQTPSREQGEHRPQQPGPQSGEQGSAAVGYGPTAGTPQGQAEAATRTPEQFGPHGGHDPARGPQANAGRSPVGMGPQAQGGHGPTAQSAPNAGGGQAPSAVGQSPTAIGQPNTGFPQQEAGAAGGFPQQHGYVQGGQQGSAATGYGPGPQMPHQQGIQGLGPATGGFQIGPQSGQHMPQPSLDDVPMRRAAKAPGSGWRKAVHHASRGAINPGMSAEERRLQELVARIRQPVRGDYRIAVLSLKGGVGKTTTTMGLGSTFASIRGDRVIAVDANPDFGTLSQRVPLQTRSTVRDVLLDHAIQRYSDVRKHTSQSTSRLEVLASERDPAASEAFNEEEYRAVARILQRFYNIIITDCGTGLMHSAMAGVLDLAHSLVLISSPAIDGARSAAATLDWLSLHGHDRLVRSAVVVINIPRAGSPNVGIQQLREYFLSRCRAVHIIPFDPHMSEGAEIDLHRLHKHTKRAYVELAATVADDFATDHRRYGS
ncbi:AAA family ATPase [Nocardia panacis]|uniref:AAA family ATPase n=1 Tax=Nocardia panacis TaxID=2340916 RepID=UPI001EF0131E|nr:AAA family ATPase [Nocardia panacis]